jgi:ribosomal protein S27E
MRHFRDFFEGRNGVDQLNLFLLGTAVVLMLVANLTRLSILTWISLGVILYSYYRLMSRNIEARSAENRRYLEVTDRILGTFRHGFGHAADREHRYYRCPGCGQMVRVPRGKGNIEIRCPKCGTTFVRRT